MGTLNLRGVPDELVARLKSEAALKGHTLLEHCVGILGGERDEEPAKPVKDSRACPECGGLNGMHQRWCGR